MNASWLVVVSNKKGKPLASLCYLSDRLSITFVVMRYLRSVGTGYVGCSVALDG